MPRISRAVAVGYPHHITQRGNYRQPVFAVADDYARYLEWLTQYGKQHKFEIWAYCLMPNHVHIVGVPGTDDALASVFRIVNMLYSHQRRPVVPAETMISSCGWRRFSAGDSLPFLQAVPAPGKTR